MSIRLPFMLSSFHSMSTPIKALLFDFGRVLCFFDRVKAMRLILEHSTLSVTPESLDAELFTLDGLGTKFESGLLTKDEFFSQLKEQYQISDDLAFEVFAKAWSEIFDEVPGVRTLIETIPPEIQCGILSNIDPIHWSSAKELDVIKTFDQRLVIKSFEQITRKPDARMYDAAMNAFNVPAENILYLDDIQEYVDTARGLGLNAEKFDARSMTHDDMRQIFVSYGILS